VPDGVPGEDLKVGRVAMTPYLGRLLEISLNNASIPSDWKIATVVCIYKGGDRSAVSKYRPISLTSLQETGTRYSGVRKASLGKE
jgi:hypothetical protein